jgi:hypothetical protein
LSLFLSDGQLNSGFSLNSFDFPCLIFLIQSAYLALDPSFATERPNPTINNSRLHLSTLVKLLSCGVAAGIAWLLLAAYLAGKSDKNQSDAST